jgi:hypothetical protein
LWGLLPGRFLQAQKGHRSFASLEYDMAAGYEVLADGIATDPKARHGITADAGDPEYYAAIFGNDDAAVPDEGHVRSGLGKAMDAVREVVNKE